MLSAHDGMTHAERAAMGLTAGDLDRLGQSITLVGDAASDQRPALETWEQMYALLALAAGVDNRARGEYEAKTWLKALHGYVIADVEAAIVEHYRRSQFEIRPANVIQIIEDGL